MDKRKNKWLNLSLQVFAIVFLFLTTISTSMAYFKFSTYFYSEGNLPYLKLHANVESVNGSEALANITYLGQDETLEIKFSTLGNNVAGKLRVIVSFVWNDGNLKNNFEDETGNRVLAGTVELANPELFNAEENTFYLIDNFEPNEEIVFITKIKFAENLPSEYLGQNVQVYILADLIQTNKGW